MDTAGGLCYKCPCFPHPAPRRLGNPVNRYSRGQAMRGSHLLTVLAAAVAAAACGPTSTGAFAVSDYAAFREEHGRICSLQFSPGHADLIGTRGRVEMTGRYILPLNPSTGLREIGQIDLAIDFASSVESPERFYRIDLDTIEISNVTGLPEASDGVSIGWTTDLELSGEVTVTEPVGTDAIPAALNIDAEGSKTSIGADDDATASRVFVKHFEGTFTQETASGRLPLAVCGTVTDRSNPPVGVDGQFYLVER